jgi:hypothetical protein
MEPGTLATIFLTALTLAVGATWGISRSEKSLKEEDAKLHKYTDEELAKVRREFGETATAIRHKLHEIELWSRDHFVLRPSFDVALGHVTHAIQQMEEKIEVRLTRMETKIERTVQRED